MARLAAAERMPLSAVTPERIFLLLAGDTAMEIARFWNMPGP
jgi:hypothetical protein